MTGGKSARPVCRQDHRPRRRELLLFFGRRDNDTSSAPRAAEDDAGDRLSKHRVARPVYCYWGCGCVSPDRAADKVRAGHQSQNRQGARPYHTAIDPRPRRRGHRVRRREFMTFLGGAAIASPIGALAQQTTNVPRVGILSDESPWVGAESFEPFAQGLRELGWIEGRNIVFEHRSAERKNEILPSLAAELVRLEPNVILAIGTPSARAAKGATQTIPIVFARTTDPVGWGLVTSLARPGGNLTGLSVQLNELTGK